MGLQSSFQFALLSEDSEKAIHISPVLSKKRIPFKLGFINNLEFSPCSDSVE